MIALLVTACTAQEPSKIQLGEVQRADVSEVVEAPAEVEARATATLRSPAEGTVGRLYVEDGDEVEKGELLAKIKSPEAQEQLREARKALREASTGGGSRAAWASPPEPVGSRLKDARRVANKIKDKQARDEILRLIKKAELELEAGRKEIAKAIQKAIRDALKQARGALTPQIPNIPQIPDMSGLTAGLGAQQRAQAEAAVRSAKRTVEKLTIKAPFDGVVSLGGQSGAPAGLGGLVPEGLGELPGGLAGQAGTAQQPQENDIAEGVPVSAGNAVVTVTDISQLHLSAEVDETDVLMVEPGIPAEAEFDAVPGGDYPAEVSGIGAKPTESAKGGVGYEVRLALKDGVLDDGEKAPRPRPGMSAVLRLTVKESRDAVAVPASAVVTSDRESVVWTIRDGVAQRRAVKVGAEGEAMVEILEGLSAGERIVVRGADTVRQGQQVP